MSIFAQEFRAIILGLLPQFVFYCNISISAYFSSSIKKKYTKSFGNSRFHRDYENNYYKINLF